MHSVLELTNECSLKDDVVERCTDYSKLSMEHKRSLLVKGRGKTEQSGKEMQTENY